MTRGRDVVRLVDEEEDDSRLEDAFGDKVEVLAHAEEFSADARGIQLREVHEDVVVEVPVENAHRDDGGDRPDDVPEEKVDVFKDAEMGGSAEEVTSW